MAKTKDQSEGSLTVVLCAICGDPIKPFRDSWVMDAQFRKCHYRCLFPEIAAKNPDAAAVQVESITSEPIAPIATTERDEPCAICGAKIIRFSDDWIMDSQNRKCHFLCLHPEWRNNKVGATTAQAATTTSDPIVTARTLERDERPFTNNTDSGWLGDPKVFQPRTFRVRFINDLVREGFGVSGRGTVTVDGKSLVYTGIRRRSITRLVALFALFLGIVVVFALGGTLIGLSDDNMPLAVVVGVVMGAGCIVYLCAKRITESISLATLSKVERDGNIVRLMAIFPERIGVIVLESSEATTAMCLMLQGADSSPVRKLPSAPENAVCEGEIMGQNRQAGGFRRADSAAASVEVTTIVHGPLRWRIVRVVAILLYVFFCMGIFVGLTEVFITRYGRARPSISGIPVVITLAIGLLFLTRLAVRKIKSYPGVNANDRVSARDLWIIFIAAFCAVVAVPLGLPVALYDIGAICAFIGTLYVAIACKSFRWNIMLMAGLIPGLVFLPIWLPSMRKASELAYIKAHNKSFDSVRIEINELYSTVDLRVAMDKPETLKPIQDLSKGLLVMDGSTQAVSEIDSYVPAEYSANDPSSLKIVIVLGEIAGYRSRDLVAPMLVYSWPNKELLKKGQLSTGCNMSDLPSKVYQSAAKVLIKELEEDVGQATERRNSGN